MNVGKLVHIVGLVFAIIAGLITIPQTALVIAVVGLVGGYYIANDDRMLFLVATVALVTIASALGAIPTLGLYLTAILTNLGALFAASAVTVILLTTYEKVSNA